MEKGNIKWTEAVIGDSALVKSENKMGVILKDYGRKFHLMFSDDSEKTYDANELDFYRFDEDEYGDGGLITNNGGTAKVGDIGVLTTRKGNIQIQITNITKNWVIFNDLTDGNKRKDNPIDKFIENYQGAKKMQSSVNSTTGKTKSGALEIVKKDRNNQDVKIGDAIHIRVLTGRYGQTKDYEGVVTAFDTWGNVELDGQMSVAYTRDYTHDDYEHGHHIWVEKIKEKDIKENLRVPKKYVPTYSGEINGEKFVIQGRDKLDEWLSKNYPGSVFNSWYSLHGQGWRYDAGEYLSPDKLPYNEVRVYESAQQGQGFLYSLMIPKNKKMKDGGKIEQENNDMLQGQIVEAAHHAKELGYIVKDKTVIEPWVVAKMERATTDLSDVTHYLEGQEDKRLSKPVYATGGNVFTNKPDDFLYSNIAEKWEELQQIRSDIKTFILLSQQVSGEELSYDIANAIVLGIIDASKTIKETEDSELPNDIASMFNRAESDLKD